MERVEENNSNEDEESSVGHPFFSNYKTIGRSVENQKPNNVSDKEQQIEGDEENELLNVHVTEFH